MQAIHAQSELQALQTLIQLILNNGRKEGIYLEVLNLLVSIQFSNEGWRKFCDFKETYLDLCGIIAQQGWERASRVYSKGSDRITKPNYRNRLVAYPDKTKRQPHNSSLDQIEKISILLNQKPGYSNLSFVFLRPADLHDQFRPGYVPCPIAGDFKYRDGLLHLSVMFRTNDALAVGYADIFYLRMLQLEVFERSKLISPNERLERGDIGNLNLFFCRSYIPRTKKVRIRGSSDLCKLNTIQIAQKLAKTINAIER